MLRVVSLGGEGDEANARGVIFERLISDVLRAIGYDTVDIRVRRLGLEYDLSGRNNVIRGEVIGEAKAWNRHIPLDALASFVGKMVPVWREDPSILGLFFSLTALSPDAREYSGHVEATENFRVIDGSALTEILEDQSGLPSEHLVSSQCKREFSREVAGILRIGTERGNLVVALLLPKGGTLPDAFACLTHDGTLLSEAETLARLQEAIPELENLAPMGIDSGEKPSRVAAERTPGPILGGSSWFDYQFPAAPQHFVGRTNELHRLEGLCNQIQSGLTRNRIVQIVSRSGVGKSSFLLKAQEILEKRGTCISVDAREIRDEIDLLALFQALARRLPSALPTFPQSLSDIDLVVRCLSQDQREMVFVLIDQLESLFPRPQLFDRFLDLFHDAIFQGRRLVFLVARKNDQPTTYDATAGIDLVRLHEMSETILLDDFSKDEAMELVGKVKYVLGRGLGEKLREQVLEFSGGFPWLHKRLLYHVVELTKSGYPEIEVLANGLRLDELFDEEVASLDEVEKDFLRQLAPVLPATLQDLAGTLGDSQHLTGQLLQLQSHRLIRMSGRTYDTYNDFFKEWLITGKVPIELKYIFRRAPKTTLRVLSEIMDRRIDTVQRLVQECKMATGAAYNVLRELRLLGLLNYDNGRISVPNEVRASFKEGVLGKLIQARVKRNRLVELASLHISRLGGSDLNELAEFVREQFPYVEAGNRTWLTYARTLANWMIEMNLINRRGGRIHTMSEHSIPSFSRLVQKDPFIPASFFQDAQEALFDLVAGSTTRAYRRRREKAIRDLRALDLAEGYGSRVDATRLGRLVTNSGPTAFKELVADVLGGQEYIALFLKKADSKSRQAQERLLFDVIQRSGDFEWSPATLHWRFKVLINWLDRCNLARRKKGRIVPRRLAQPSLTDSTAQD